MIVALFIFSVLYIAGSKKSDNVTFKGVDRSNWELRRKRYEAHLKRVQPMQPGENGAAVVLSADDQAKADSLFNKEAFNIIASDMIAMDRSVPDVRDPG